MKLMKSKNGFSTILFFLLNLTPAPVTSLQDDPLSYWRERISQVVSSSLIVFGGIILIPIIFGLASEELWFVIAIDIAIFFIGLFVSFSRKVSFLQRQIAQFSLIYIIAIVLQLSIPNSGAAFPWLFAIGILAGAQMGKTAALNALVANTLFFVVLGIFLASGMLSHTGMAEVSLLTWSLTAINFLALNAGASFALAVLLEGISISIQNEKIAQNLLQIEQERLVSANDHLHQEIGEREEMAEQLRQIATHDALTQLPNRFLFTDRLDHAIDLAKRSNTLLAVMFLDLDNFKAVNDALNHQQGDNLLNEVAQRLLACIRSSDTVARLGGDEFAILYENIHEIGHIHQMVKKIQDTLLEPFSILEKEFFVSTSIGISLFPGNGEDANSLLLNADMAMYYAKKNGKNTYQFYFDDLEKQSLMRLEIIADLRLALEKNELVLYYQPIYDVTKRKVLGAEVLLRWNCAKFGLLLPADFLPIAEEIGLIHLFDEWVLAIICRQLKAWENTDLKKQRLWMNLSEKQLLHPEFIDTVERYLQETGINPQLLEFEISETTLINEQKNIEGTLRRLKKLGVHLAIDHFGSKYAAIKNLPQLNFDTLKIDRSFMDDIFTDPVKQITLNGAIQISQRLRMDIIIEGVESIEQIKYIQKLGNFPLQGWAIAPAMPLNEYEDYASKILLSVDPSQLN
ncbi:MAG: hypothetical protein CVU39_23960 [Chloroflexi bacterium HGW-Chloroflexi-10]|nr:MAG: hypothetical protein CVU39_23960 [Chloroflexi bacterium HGW-Chloroflexi-10]